MAGISLNGTTFHPSDIQADELKIGESLVARSGARTWVQYGTKRSWDLSWKNVAKATRDAVRTIFRLTTTFPYVDEDGVSVTVQCEASGYSSSVATIEDAATVRYDLKLTIYEA
jgi:hypothetical protein